MNGPKEPKNERIGLDDPFATALDEALAAATVVVEKRAGSPDDDLWLSSPNSPAKSDNSAEAIVSGTETKADEKP